MGTWRSTNNNTKKLCNDLIEDTDVFLIKVVIRSYNKLENGNRILDFLQKTGPAVSYQHGKFISLLYDASKKNVMLRSNVSGEILSTLSSEIAVYCIKSDICEPYMIDVEINITSYYEGIKDIINTVELYGYDGYMHGVESLSKKKIKDQFGL